MKSVHLFYLFLFLLLGLTACREEDPPTPTPVPDTDSALWSKAEGYYLRHIDLAIAELDTLARVGSARSPEARERFIRVRRAFKKAEPFGAYLNPEVGHRVNGPALPILTEDSQKLLPPLGLQKLEETIYEGGETHGRFLDEVFQTRAMMENLRRNMAERSLNPRRFFISTHQQLLRIISLSIVGFDTPVSLLGLEETQITLRGLAEVYGQSIRPLIRQSDPRLDEAFLNQVDSAVAFVDRNRDFETFDRYSFIRDYMNPITRSWVAIRKESGLWDGTDTRPFNFEAPTFFEEDAFNTDFFVPSNIRKATEAQIALGRKLFHDPNLSEGSSMACVTCHQPSKAYADGMVVNLDNQGTPLERNTPTLINVAYQQRFFWDGRSPNLMDQISSVFNNEREFNSGVHRFSSEIMIDTSYAGMFEAAYGNVSQRNNQVIKALSAYIATLNGFDSKFDRNMRGEEDSFTEQEKLGFNLYMGKALCATCHFIPLTNGTVPPFFTETEREVIGVPETAANLELDDDLGFFWNYKEEVHRGMFKTPTVRNAELTGPYMHNGVYQTLEEVVDFYNKGGGGGLGFDLPYQTLPFDELNLTENEQKALVAFMKTLTDTGVEKGS